jgi:hypothetical protein
MSMNRKIVTLCGSSRFEAWYHIWAEALGLAGHATFGLASYPSMHSKREWYSEEEKAGLDKLHKWKIEQSTAVLFLNVFGYVGQSTLSEISYAFDLNREIYFLESWGADCGVDDWQMSDLYQRARRQAGVPSGWRSPLSTCNHPSPYDLDLLPEAGALRNSIVARIESRTLAAMHDLSDGPSLNASQI